MFHLTSALAKIANFNPRAEKHGDDNKLAADIKCELTIGASVLEHFDSHLRDALYRAVKSGEQPDLIDGDAALIAVKFPRLEPVRWDEEWPGYRLEIGGELEHSDPLVLIDVTLKKFTFKPLEGGSVSISFNAICHPEPDEAGELCSLIQETVLLSLIPPLKQDPGPDLLTDEKPADMLEQAAAALEAEAATA
jgi:hypothetical protein